MRQVFADTLYWVASITPGDPWHAPTLRAVAALGPVHLVTTEEVLVEFLSAYAGRGAYLRGKALQTVRAILANVSVTVRPQTHESFMTGLDVYASRSDKAYSLVVCAYLMGWRHSPLKQVLQ
jgi:uncharacterized protein